MQYVPALEAAGFQVEVAPFFDDRYLRRLYAGQRNYLEMVRYFFRRFQVMCSKSPPDMLWVEYEILPWMPWIIEQRLFPADVPVISDYDDAVFHRYDLHRLGPVRWLLGDKIDRFMARSDLVMAGNPYLAERAWQAGARHVEVVPTVVDAAEYKLYQRTEEEEDVLRVGWIGTPQSWNALARPIYEVLSGPLEQSGAIFRAVGAELERARQGRLEIVPWTEEHEVSLIRSMDIGLMPMPDSPWTRGKCGYKLLQYMACGLPVVASPVGVNSQIVEHGVNGFLAESEQDWRQAVLTLLSDAGLRKRMGAAGRARVEKHYSLQVWAPRLAGLIGDLMVKI